MEERGDIRAETAKLDVTKKMLMWPLYWELRSEAASRKRSARYVDYDIFLLTFIKTPFEKC